MEIGMISLWDLEYRLDRGMKMQLVDLRTPAEYQNGHICGAVNIPYSQLKERFQKLFQEAFFTIDYTDYRR